MKNEKNNWYDNPKLIDSLLFLFPPLGIYALLKSKKAAPQAVRIALVVLIVVIINVVGFSLIFRS